jgi:TonB-linked SusC/RagA family outer membrane protein
MTIGRLAQSCLSRFSVRPLAMSMATLALLTAAHAARAQGTIVGQVTTAEANAPLNDVRLIVVGTNASAVTGQDGRFRLTNVRTGSVEVQVLRVGYTSLKKSVTVTAGTTVNVDFRMTVAVVQLQEVVTTATGQQRKVELGNALATIDAAKRAEAAPVRDLVEMITAQSPSVAVTPGNYTGAAAQIRIRGLSSISNSGPPIYIVDGVRIDASTGIGLTGGGASTSRVNDILPQDIEDIEIVKGPSAATLYGTNAANGVVVITTKRGRAGRTNWNIQTEVGTLDDRNAYPNTYANWGHCSGAACSPTELANPIRCLLYQTEPDGIRPGAKCVSDSVTSANILTTKSLSPIALGNRNLNTVQVSGGTELVRFFTAGTLENEAGPLKMPDFSMARLDSIRTPIRGEFIRPSYLQRASFRGNVNTTISPKFELNLTTSYFKSDTRGAQSDNNVNSYYYNALTNPGFIPSNLPLCISSGGTACLGYTGIGSLGQELHGYGGYTPAEIFQSYNNEGNQRFGGTITSTWRPLSWLQNDATTGLDIVALDIVNHCFLNECADFSTQRQGSYGQNHSNTRQFTTNLTSTASWNPKLWANLKTSIGAQYVNQESDGTSVSSSQLGPGVQGVGQAGSRSGSNTAPTATKTLGAFTQEQMAFRDRLFLTAGVRTDQNSAFGAQLKRVFYPKYSLSWLASDEPFFPTLAHKLDQLRVRIAYGESGIQPGSTTALQTFSTSTVRIANTDQSALAASNIGNKKLRPERTLEWEGGLDMRAFNNRVSVELTYYSKQTRDALESYSYAPSAGASSSITRNLGGVKNAGVEASITTQIVDTKNFSWDVTVGGSHNKNKVMYLGFDDVGVPLPPTPRTSTSRTIPGYPLGSVWYEPFTWSDDNHDGIISPDEVHGADITKGDSSQYVGPSFPTDLANVSTGVDLFNRKVRITVLANYQGGFNKFNNTSSFLCGQTVGCPTTQVPGADLFDQARYIAANVIQPATLRTSRGYSENLNFWRLREITVNWTLPDVIARRGLRSPGANVVFGARNVHVWSSYTGEDPEANYSTGNSQSDLLTAGPPTVFTVHLNLKY